MTHLTEQIVHRYTGDPVTIRITVQELTPAEVLNARWVTGTLEKTLGSGITETGTTTAVLEVDITSAETAALGPGPHDWQAEAGGVDPLVVSIGQLNLSQRK